MKMSESDKNKLLATGKFLVAKGFEVKTTEYSVCFESEKVRISAFYESYDNCADVDIRFLEGNHHFIVGWIWVVHNGGRHIEEKGINKLIMLLNYVEANFDDITNLSWCQNSRELLTDFLTAKRPPHWQQLH